MQQITGRLTADATIKQLQSGQSVVNFNIAENQDYKPKGSTEWVKNVTYFSCSFWRGTNVAAVLRKGTMVQLSGQVRVRLYETNTGQTAAALNFNTDRIDVLAYVPKDKEQSASTAQAGAQDPNSNKSRKTTKKAGATTNADDDLPF